MYYVVNKEKIKEMYLDKISKEKGKVDLIEIKNMKYMFDKDNELENITISVINEPAFALTTSGYVEFIPSYFVDSRGDETIYDKLFSYKYIENHADVVEAELKYKKSRGFSLAYPICSGYICIEPPENAIHIEKKDFFAEPIIGAKIEENKHLKVYSTKNLWIFDLTKVKRPAYVSVRLKDREFRLFRENSLASEIFVRKGLCIREIETKEILCL